MKKEDMKITVERNVSGVKTTMQDVDFDKLGELLEQLALDAEWELNVGGGKTHD